MPSRKRNKGKERRAKAAQSAAERSSWWLGWARWNEHPRAAPCNHGCASIPDSGHAVYKFIDAFGGFVQEMKVRNSSELTASEKFANLCEEHLEVWDDSRMGKMAIDVMLRVGTNAILSGDDQDMTSSYTFSKGILLLEYYRSQCATAATMTAAMKDRSADRDIIKFYLKRTPCSCLKQKYSQAKKCPKIGVCYHCKQKKERKYLMVCNGCNFAQYCSQECQVGDWPNHKGLCREIQVPLQQLASSMEEHGSEFT